MSKSQGATATSTDPPSFLEISEAWAVLSKPDIKSKYDSARGLFTRSAEPLPDTSRMISQDFLVQRQNYEVVKRQASSNWHELRDKYKQEKWLNLPLSERKV